MINYNTKHGSRIGVSKNSTQIFVFNTWDDKRKIQHIYKFETKEKCLDFLKRVFKI